MWVELNRGNNWDLGESDTNMWTPLLMGLSWTAAMDSEISVSCCKRASWCQKDQWLPSTSTSHSLMLSQMSNINNHQMDHLAVCQET